MFVLIEWAFICKSLRFVKSSLEGHLRSGLHDRKKAQLCLHLKICLIWVKELKFS